MDEETLAALARAARRQLSPDQVVAIQHEVRRQLLHDEAVRGTCGAVKRARAPHREPLRREPGVQADAQVSPITQERDEARNGWALAEQRLVSPLRQLLPGQEPVSLCRLGVRRLDAYGLNEVLAGYALRLRSRRAASERQVNARVGERA